MLLLDACDRVLLLRCHDPDDPALGPWWELPGGGIEAGESGLEAAVREVAEETGVIVDPDLVGPCLLTESSTFTFRGARRWCDVEVRVARLRADPVTGACAPTPGEVGSIDEVAWLPMAAVLAGRERFYPDHLPRLLPDLLAGRARDLGFRAWN